jgi:hypothetical protein
MKILPATATANALPPTPQLNRHLDAPPRRRPSILFRQKNALSNCSEMPYLTWRDGIIAFATLPSLAVFPIYSWRKQQSGIAPAMAEPQLSVRSAKARDLARRLARREHRSIADIVERALEAYEVREAGREPALAFYARLANDYGSDLDLDAVIRENRKIDSGPEF